jgi:hypothetical protein
VFPVAGTAFAAAYQTGSVKIEKFLNTSKKDARNGH